VCAPTVKGTRIGRLGNRRVPSFGWGSGGSAEPKNFSTSQNRFPRTRPSRAWCASIFASAGQDLDGLPSPRTACLGSKQRPMLAVLMTPVDLCIFLGYLYNSHHRWRLWWDLIHTIHQQIPIDLATTHPELHGAFISSWVGVFLSQILLPPPLQSGPCPDRGFDFGFNRRLLRIWLTGLSPSFSVMPTARAKALGVGIGVDCQGRTDTQPRPA
jgi:hypothetical protein